MYNKGLGIPVGADILVRHIGDSQSSGQECPLPSPHWHYPIKI